MAEQLPHNDPDLTLAQQMEKLREQGRSLSELDDPLMQQLLEYKKKKQQSYKGPKINDKQAVWDRIASATEPNEKTPVLQLFSSSTVRWAAAAVLLIGAIFSFIYLQFGHQPELLAASGSTIKTVTLKDGSTVKLRPHSKLFDVKQQADASVYQLKGEGQFEVRHNPNRVFSVKTGNGKVSVLGTRFILSSWGEQTQVYLQRGAVKVEALQQDTSVVLKPGESALVSNNKPITVEKKAEAKEFTDWINQQLIFKNKQVSRVAAELEQQFNISITLPPKIAQQQLSGQLSLKNLQTALDDLGLALNGTFTKTAKRDYTFNKASQ